MENGITALIEKRECIGIQSLEALSNYFKCLTEVFSLDGHCVQDQVCMSTDALPHWSGWRFGLVPHCERALKQIEALLPPSSLTLIPKTSDTHFFAVTAGWKFCKCVVCLGLSFNLPALRLFACVYTHMQTWMHASDSQLALHFCTRSKHCHVSVNTFAGVIYFFTCLGAFNQKRKVHCADFPATASHSDVASHYLPCTISPAFELWCYWCEANNELVLWQCWDIHYWSRPCSG